MEASPTPLERLLDRLPSATPFQRLLEHVSSPVMREGLALHIRHSARVLAAVGFLVYLSLVCSFSFLSYAPGSDFPASGGVAENPPFHVDTSTGRIKDRFGRERIFHGVNVVFKGEPWLPQLQGFDSQLSFSDEDIRILRQLGLNVVRLGVMWPGVHPERGVVNQTYLGIIKDLVHRLHTAGIYTLIDFHQDVFAERFCGEGVPNWLLDDVPFSGGNSGRESLESNLRRSLTGSTTGLRAAPAQGSSLQREALGSELTSSLSLRRGGFPAAAEGSSSSVQAITSGGMRHLSGGPTQSAQSEDHQQARAQQGVGGLKNETTGYASNAVGDVDFPCVGYAVCMKPQEYAESFPEPLLSRYYSGRRGNDPELGEFGGTREAAADSDAAAAGPRDSARRRGRGLLAQGTAIGTLQSQSQSQSQPLSEAEGELHSATQAQQAVAAASAGLRGRMAATRSYKTPSRDQCLMIDWGIYHFTFAVSRGFQDLYENRWGWRDRLAEYWADVATAVKGEEGVLGLDLINEPWVGDIFFNPLLIAPGVADRLNYEPFYNHLQAAIRKVDPNRIIFFEGTTYDNAVSGFTAVPGGLRYANMSVLSYHYYHPPNVAPRATFQQRERERQRLQCGWMLTEFGIPNSRPDWVTLTGAEHGADEGTGTSRGTGEGTRAGTGAGTGTGAGRRMPSPGEDRGSHQWFHSVPGTACLPDTNTTGRGRDTHTAGSRSIAARGTGGAHRCHPLEGAGGCSRKAESWAQFAEEWGRLANESCVRGGRSVVSGAAGTSVGTQCASTLASSISGCPGFSEKFSLKHVSGSSLEDEREGSDKGSEVAHESTLETPLTALRRIKATFKAGFDPRRPEVRDTLKAYGVTGKPVVTAGTRSIASDGATTEGRRGALSEGAVVGEPKGRMGEPKEKVVPGSVAGDGAMSMERRKTLSEGGSVGEPPKALSEGAFVGEPTELLGEAKERKVVPGSWSELVETLELADEHAQSWMAWEYKPFRPVTGANYGLFQPDGSLHPLVLQFFWRTFPVAVAGTIREFKFDPYSSNFTMTYTASAGEGERERGRNGEERGRRGENGGDAGGVGEWVGGLVGRLRSALWGAREEGSGEGSSSSSSSSEETKGGFRNTAEDDYSDTSDMEGVHPRNSERRRAKGTLRSVTEIHVCCNRDMHVMVDLQGVEVRLNEDGSVVQLWHQPQHAGKTITVRVYPRDL